MSKKRIKWTYQEVFDYFGEHGCLLLSKEFIKQKDILDYICICGTISKVNFDNFKKGKRCQECKKVKCGEAKRLTYNEVKERFKEFGCVLLSDNYQNNSEPLDYLCVCGVKNSISLMSLSVGELCYECGIIKLKLNNTLGYEYVKNVFNEHGCTLLSEVYVSAKDKLDYICECKSIANISFDKFQQGQRCSKCKIRKISNKNRIPYLIVVESFKENNCELLISESDYISSSSMMNYRCECGNESETNLFGMRNGVRCRECGNKKRRETMYKNGTAPSSTQQTYICKLLNGQLNYPVNSSSLDIAFPEDNTYIEYDGSGHWMSIQMGNKTEEQFNKYEKARRYALLRRGWKEIRIISRNDKLPSDENILKMYGFAKTYLETGRHYIQFDIDNELVTSSQFSLFYDFGELISAYNVRKNAKSKEVS